MNRFLWMVILSHRSCLKKNPENIVAPFRYNTMTQNQNVDTIFYSKYFFYFLYRFKKNCFSFLQIRQNIKKYFRQKLIEICIEVYFKFIFALSFKSFIFSLRRYFGTSDRFLQLNLKFLQPFGFFFLCVCILQRFRMCIRSQHIHFFHAVRSSSIFSVRTWIWKIWPEIWRSWRMKDRKALWWRRCEWHLCPFPAWKEK